MVWGGISVKGAIPLKRIIGTMYMKVSYFLKIILKFQSIVLQIYILHSITTQVYHRLLVYHALPRAKKLLGKEYVFQEDNDPKHASKMCRIYLGRKEKQDS